MTLDFTTLMVAMATNLFTISLVLPFMMGRVVSPAARHVQASLLLQMAGWLAFIATGWRWERELAILAVALHGAAQWMLYRALELWLGPRPLRHILLVLVVLLPVGYGLGFGNYAWRVGWSNALLVTILCIVARAALYPRTAAGRNWRYVLVVSLLTSAAFTLARGVLGAFTDQYPHFRAPHPVNLAAAVVTNVNLVIGTIALLVAWRHETEQKLRMLAMTDALTGLPNRRGFTANAESLLAHTQRHDLAVTAMMLDLDHFKKVNDTHGHEAGDRALQLFGRLISDTSRSGDTVARLGGEEFAVLLLHARAAPASPSFDRRLREKLWSASAAELGFVLEYSVGAATFTPRSDDNLEALMARADAALYKAKAQGRARLVVDGQHLPEALEPVG